MSTSNEELVALVITETKHLLAGIRKDIEETKVLTEEDRKNCAAICQRVETEHTRLKIEFLNESLILINQALETLDQQKLMQIHRAWSLALQNVTRQCETFAGPLMKVLEILSQNDQEMKTKYAGVLTGTVASSVLVGIAVGLIIIHCHPGGFLQLGFENILANAIAPLLAIVLATGCVIGKITSIDLRTAHRKGLDFARSILAKHFPNYIDSPINDSSQLEVAMVIKKSIDTLHINEAIWQNREALEMIKNSIQNQLKDLHQLK
jgi:hypothetical protein